MTVHGRPPHRDAPGGGGAVAVVGAGFSGAVTAAHLLRRGSRVVLVERSGRFGPGVAYGTRSPAHLLNVPAARIGAFADDPGGFLRHARESGIDAAPGDYLPRALYGRYLERVLAEAEAAAGPGGLVRVAGEVRAVDETPRGAGAVLHLGGGERIAARRVVLAIGDSGSASAVPGVEGAGERCVADPWAPGALDGVRRGDRVLLVGTGLTMVDLVLELHARVQAPIHAVSRHGLLPRVHADEAGDPHPAPAPFSPGRPARDYLRALRAMDAAGTEWRETLAALRAETHALWRALPDGEKARFLRHLRPYWDVHRHRASPAAGRALDAVRAAGGLVVGAARILSLRAGLGGVEVVLRRRGARAGERTTFDWVIDCTGRGGDPSRSGNPLLRALLRAGQARPDPFRIGLELARDNALVGADGVASRVLYYVGPLLRARDWEATAIAELREQALRVSATVSRARADPRPALQATGP